MADFFYIKIGLFVGVTGWGDIRAVHFVKKSVLSPDRAWFTLGDFRLGGFAGRKRKFVSAMLKNREFVARSADYAQFAFRKTAQGVSKFPRKRMLNWLHLDSWQEIMKAIDSYATSI